MKTAVEWLLEHLEPNIMWTDKARKAVQQAKEMEKELIIDSINQFAPDWIDGEKYYNENFKSE